MGNGGSPPDHLPSSTAPDDLRFPCFADFPCIAAKWLQPPARAPDCKWMRDWETSIWELLVCNTDRPSWILCGKHEDLELAAKGEQPYRPLHPCPELAAYHAWKRAVDDMWLSHATLDEHHALIETRARLELALARQVRQHRELTAARTIFLWLCRRRLHTRLA